MDSQDLTAEQCQAMQAQIRKQQRYFDQLLERMNETGFPPRDPLRRDVTEARDQLKGLWMTLHYLQCAGRTGREAVIFPTDKASQKREEPCRNAVKELPSRSR
jgi:hypothetical protein